MTRIMEADAICFDFYNTLVHHADGKGRGVTLMEYLDRAGLKADPWEHQFIYDVFNPIAKDYPSDYSSDEMQVFRNTLSEMVFKRLNIKENGISPEDHAENIWRILGPDCLKLFPEVTPVLQQIKHAGLPVAIVSNWHCGLSRFCEHLGIIPFVDFVIASAEVESTKPDQHIFNEAIRLLRTEPKRTVHIGDTYDEDFIGAQNAGFQALHLNRRIDAEQEINGTIRNLNEVLVALGIN
jgi:HAD superfamily hydrolase (TIGR01549 family)